jgi:hypothetical protein
MCWGFCIGEGWYNIIDNLCSTIQHHIAHQEKQIEWAHKWNDRVNDRELEWTAFADRKERPIPEPIEQVIAVQVKEKFGGLRFYYNGGDEYIRGAVDMAEMLSLATCDVCGDRGHYNLNNGWVSTRCENHKLHNWIDI